VVVLWFVDEPNLQGKDMNKSLAQGFLLVLFFFGIWLGLARINWTEIFNVHQLTTENERRLGEIFLDVFLDSNREIHDKQVVSSIDSLVIKICSANSIERDYLKIHIVENKDVNAFALPDGHLIVNSALISNSGSQEELAGVICHEIAHIQANHVTKKLIKEIGITVLIAMTNVNDGGQLIKEGARVLSSTAFDRSLEREADVMAVDYLVSANIDPKPFANFLAKLAENENEELSTLTWISTHPDSKERAKYILEYSKNKVHPFKPPLSNSTWEMMRSSL
jgi:predicted Zn-dependent protease